MSGIGEKLHWFVLRVRPQKELLAKISLRRRNLSVRYPEREVWRHPNDKAKRRKVYFPKLYGYVFVGFRQHQLNIDFMRTVINLHFVGKFLSINGRPIQIPQEWLDAVDKGPDAVAKLHQRNMRTYGEFDIEDIVRIMDGPFEGFEGMVEDIDEDTDQALITLDIFGRRTPVRLDVGQAMKAA